MSFSSDNNDKNIYSTQSEVQKTIDRIKADIRMKFHQNYFKRQRQMRLNMQNSQIKISNNYQYNQRNKQQKNGLASSQKNQDKKYNICLNNQYQLYPVEQPINNTNPHKLHLNKIPDINCIQTYTNLLNLVNLYNLIREGYYNEAPYIIISLMERILEEIQCKFITLNQIYYHINNKLDHVRSTMRSSYEQNQSIAIMLLIIYKEIQNRIAAISNQQQYSQYRRRLIQICDRYKVLDVKILGVFGVNSIKCIEY